jgi:hypothetical protein
MSLQEGLLTLGGERDMKRSARARQSHQEHPALHQRTGDTRPELTEINFGFRARGMDLRDGHLNRLDAQLDTSTSHIP